MQYGCQRGGHIRFIFITACSCAFYSAASCSNALSAKPPLFFLRFERLCIPLLVFFQILRIRKPASFPRPYI
jgi:drug/metabolite transporter (DMT)-like permease